MSKIHWIFQMRSEYEIEEFAIKQTKILDGYYSRGEIDLDQYIDQKILLDNYVEEQHNQLNNIKENQ